MVVGTAAGDLFLVEGGDVRASLSLDPPAPVEAIAAHAKVVPPLPLSPSPRRILARGTSDPREGGDGVVRGWKGRARGTDTILFGARGSVSGQPSFAHSRLFSLDFVGGVCDMRDLGEGFVG